MTYDYNGLIINTVIPALKEYGIDTVLRRNENTDTFTKKFNNIESRWFYENDSSGEIVYELVESIKEYPITVLQDNVSIKEIDGKNVLAGDKLMYTRPTDIKPVVGDVVRLSKDYRVYQVKTITPASLDILYILYVRS